MISERIQQFRIHQAIEVRIGIHIRCHHDFLDAWNMLLDFFYLRQAVMLLAVVGISGGTEQNLGLNLAEPVHDAVDAEIR